MPTSPTGSSRRGAELEKGKQQWDLWWETEQHDLRAAGKAERKGKEVDSETQEINRRGDRGGSKCEQSQEGAKLHSLLSLAFLSVPKFIGFSKVAVPEL